MFTFKAPIRPDLNVCCFLPSNLKFWAPPMIPMASLGLGVIISHWSTKNCLIFSRLVSTLNLTYLLPRDRLPSNSMLPNALVGKSLMDRPDFQFWSDSGLWILIIIPCLLSTSSSSSSSSSSSIMLWLLLKRFLCSYELLCSCSGAPQ